jgi:putative modified peptide
MAIKKTGGTKSAPLDPKVADKLLDLLSTDNEFRRLFKKDPQAALAKVGHPEAKAAVAALRKGPPFTPPGPPAVIPPTTASCCQVQRIAPKADIIKARTELRSMLTSSLAQTPPALEASILARRSRK